MRTIRTIKATLLTVLISVLVYGCDKSTTETEKPSASGSTTDTTPAPPPGTAAANRATTPAQLPASHPPAANPHAAPTSPKQEGNTLMLDGLTLSVPEGWMPGPKPTGPMSAQFAFVLPKADADAEDGAVRISHYPGMRGKDEMNINRWIAQTTKPDGTPNTRADAQIESKELEGGDITVVQVSGSVRATMRSAPLPNAKMIAVIINHPRGPHFVVASGPSGTVDKWAASFDNLLESADVK